MKLFVLSKEDTRLAADEIRALINLRVTEKGGYALAEAPNIQVLKRRLAFTKEIHDVLFTCPISKLSSRVSSFTWLGVIKSPFAVRSRSDDMSSRDCASMVVRAYPRGRVGLKDPKTVINFFLIDRRVYVTRTLHVFEHDFTKRLPHKRVAPHPSSLPPKLARALVNLTGIRRGKVHDPFCGAGGILIEAGLMGLEGVGFDIDPQMIERAKKQLKEQGVKAKLEVRDSLTLKRAMAYVVTDLPYGRNTKKSQGTPERDFLELLDHHLRRRAVVCFGVQGEEDIQSIKHIIARLNLRIKRSYTWYIHKSLSKYIVVLNRESLLFRP